MIIYILSCSEKKYYIGKTLKYVNVDEIFLQHLSDKNTCSFTKKYSPIEIIEHFETNDPLDEDKMTKKYMMMYGIENVRGGSYSKIELEDWQIKSLEQEFISVSDIYLKDFCTIIEIDEEIIKIKKDYEKIQYLKEEINKTELFKLELLPTIKEISQKEKIINKLEQEEYELNKKIINKLEQEEYELNKKIIFYGKKADEQEILKMKNYRSEILKNYKEYSLINSYIIYVKKEGLKHNTYSNFIPKKYIEIFYPKTIINENNVINDKNKHLVQNLELMLLELINYNLEKKEELKILLSIHKNEDEITNKLIKLYERRIELINV